MTLPLTVRDLLPADLPSCGWSGSPLHLDAVARELKRARRGEVDYLAVCPPSGEPVAIGGVDYRARPDAGLLWQLGVLPALQSCGIGSVLIAAAEQRIRGRGLHHAELAVEEDNPRARALYERLGYVAYGQEAEVWDEQGPDGAVRSHEALCIRMRKTL
ncbi:GNAT family N-acetyltransferase [Streptomyces sp. NPDC017993]|uniref:GNAT family N-acetyltransferase n=1 Tax=Streptomyces sp. NPDC017993 TaxID=3365027 RepID=UPI003791DB95